MLTGQCDGFHQQHYAGVHFTFVQWVIFPLALLLWRRAENNLRCAVGLEVLAASMFYEGAVYPLPHLVLVLAAETLTRVSLARSLPPILRTGAIAGVLRLGRAPPSAHQSSPGFLFQSLVDVLECVGLQSEVGAHQLDVHHGLHRERQFDRMGLDLPVVVR